MDSPSGLMSIHPGGFRAGGAGRVGGLADAGLFLPVKDWAGGPGYVRLWRRAAEMQRAALNPACVAAQGPTPPAAPPARPRAADDSRDVAVVAAV